MPVYFPRALGLAAAMAWFGAFSAHDFASRLPYVLASASVFVFLSVKRAIDFKFVFVLFAIAILFFCYGFFLKPAPSGNDLSRFNGFNALIRVELIEDPRPFGKNAFSCSVAPVQIIFPRSATLDGKAQLVFSYASPINFKKGDFLEVKVGLRSPENPVEPWKFQTRDFLNRQSIFCIATTKSGGTKLPLRAHSFWSTAINQCTTLAAEKRRAILEVHAANIGTTYAALLQSIVLGDKTAELPKEIKSDFRHVGLSHVTAASGFNLTVVVGITYWLMTLICKTGALKRIIPLLAIGLFVLMAGPSPSVVRAALCCTTILLAGYLRRKFSPLAVLSLSVFISLVYDPILATDVGAELSYAATFGIISLAKNTILPGEGGTHEKINLQAGKRWLLNNLAVLFGVQAAVLPIQLVYFWQTGLAFLPANLVVEPVIAPLTIAGFVSSFLAALPNGGSPSLPGYLIYWIDQFACLIIKFILAVVGSLSHFPNAVINVGPPNGAQVFIYYLMVIVLLQCLKIRRNLVFAGAAYLAALALLLYRPPLRQPIICASPNFLGVVSVSRQGFYLGAPEQAEKFFAYYGANAKPVDESNERAQFAPLPKYPQIFRWQPDSKGATDRCPLVLDHFQNREAFAERTNFQIRIFPNRRILHSHRFEGDRAHPYILFCNHGLTASFGPN